MKILYVASEANPYAASGGLGDVMGALPAAVAAEGHECQVIMPLYDTMKAEYREKLELVLDMSFNLSWRHTGASVYRLKHNNVTYLFVENHYYFDRGRLYGEFDDAERFAFFSRAVMDILPFIDFYPEVLHCHDWQTALVPIYYNLFYANQPGYENIKTVFTIHNIQYQGQYTMEILEDVYSLEKQCKLESKELIYMPFHLIILKLETQWLSSTTRTCRNKDAIWFIV